MFIAGPNSILELLSHWAACPNGADAATACLKSRGVY